MTNHNIHIFDRFERKKIEHVFDQIMNFEIVSRSFVFEQCDHERFDYD